MGAAWGWEATGVRCCWWHWCCVGMFHAAMHLRALRNHYLQLLQQKNRPAQTLNRIKGQLRSDLFIIWSFANIKCANNLEQYGIRVPPLTLGCNPYKQDLLHKGSLRLAAA